MLKALTEQNHNGGGSIRQDGFRAGADANQIHVAKWDEQTIIYSAKAGVSPADANVAQLVEQRTRNAQVGRSNRLVGFLDQFGFILADSPMESFVTNPPLGFENNDSEQMRCDAEGALLQRTYQYVHE